MASLDFYALGDDLRQLFSFLYAETDIVVFELSSEFDREPRRFGSLEQLSASYELGARRAAYLQLWSPSVMIRPVIRRIELTVPARSFRYAVEGAGLMQLYLDGADDGVIYHTHFGHWNEAGARQRSMHPADDCDWRALLSLSTKIRRRIRGKFAAGKLFTRPILHHAFDAVQGGFRLGHGQAAYGADSKEIQKLAKRA
jgi:hypothetical protein